MREVHDMDRRQRGRSSANTWGMIAVAISFDTCGVRLVEGRPMFYPVAELPNRQMRIVGEPRSNISVLPAAAILERLREVPVVETDPRFNVGSHDRIDQAIIEFQSLFVRPTPPLRQDAGPRGR